MIYAALVFVMFVMLVSWFAYRAGYNAAQAVAYSAGVTDGLLDEQRTMDREYKQDLQAARLPEDYAGVFGSYAEYPPEGVSRIDDERAYESENRTRWSRLWQRIRSAVARRPIAELHDQFERNRGR